MFYLVSQYLVVVLIFGLLIPWLYEFVSSKTRADIQARVGPNQAFGSGFFQWLADSVKLVFKRKSSESSVVWFCLWIKFLIVTVLFLSIPFYRGFEISTTSADFMFVLSLFLALTFVEGLRIFLMLTIFQLNRHNGQVSRQLSVMPAIGFCLLAVALETRSFGWAGVTSIEGGQFLFFSNPPLGTTCFFLFHICGLIFFGKRPFYSGNESGDVIGGAQFFLESYLLKTAYLCWVSFSVLLFFGGHPELSGLSDTWAAVAQMLWLAARVLGVMLISDWITISLPTMRTDQSTDFCWSFLVPVTVIVFAVTLLVKVGAYLL
jgi:NADH:ubiquinone oxidoreductase subunit H